MKRRGMRRSKRKRKRSGGRLILTGLNVANPAVVEAHHHQTSQTASKASKIWRKKRRNQNPVVGLLHHPALSVTSLIVVEADLLHLHQTKRIKQLRKSLSMKKKISCAESRALNAKLPNQYVSVQN